MPLALANLLTKADVAQWRNETAELVWSHDLRAF